MCSVIWYFIYLLIFMFLVTSEQRVFFLVFTFNFYSFFGDESIWISCPFENLVYVLLLSSKCSLFILDTSPLSDTCVRNWVVLMSHFIIQWVQPLMNFWVPTRMSEPLVSTFILRSTHIELYRSLFKITNDTWETSVLLPDFVQPESPLWKVGGKVKWDSTNLINTNWHLIFYTLHFVSPFMDEYIISTWYSSILHQVSSTLQMH